jgi:glycosyltransferase involved in cell wall biosynthesis
VLFRSPQNEAEIAQALIDFTEQPEETLQMGMKARSLFEAKYNWEMEALKLREFYLSL